MKTKPAGYAVLYASVGCLADDTSGPYDSTEEAAEYIRAEIESTLEEDEPEPPEIAEIVADMGATDPRDGSLYSWEIIELDSAERAEWEAGS